MTKQASKNNLITFADRTPEEHRKISSKGGIASGKARQEKKRLREFIELALEKKIKTPEGEKTTEELMALKAVQEALKGDWKAYELVVALSGQKPADKVEVATVSKETIKQVEEFLNSDEK